MSHVIEIERLWAQEAERRLGEIERGEVTLIPGEEVFEKIRRKYAPQAFRPILQEAVAQARRGSPRGFQNPSFPRR